MKKKIAVILALLLVIALTLAGCSLVEKSYTVTFVLGDGREDVVTEVRASSELYTPDAPEGKVFGGWFLDKNLTRPYLAPALKEDTVLYARFIERGEYAVSFAYNNGEPSTTIIISGAITEPTHPTREGYVFAGFFDAATGEPFVFGRAPERAHTVISAEWREASEGVLLTVHPGMGEESYTVEYPYSAKADEPELSETVGFGFSGWYYDEECKRLFDFDAPLTEDTHIYAGWSVDHAALGNAIARELMTASVEIRTERRSFSYGTVSTGSGVVYKCNAGYYYILTNAHVVAPDPAYPSTTYKVVDAYANEYKAELLISDASYDLAVLRISLGMKELKTVSFAAVDPVSDSELFSLGSPGGQLNTVTYGILEKYDHATVTDSEVEFMVGWHSCYTANGSSGGGVFNSECQLVGINFAAAEQNGEFLTGAFIPIARVAEFLTNNHLTP